MSKQRRPSPDPAGFSVAVRVRPGAGRTRVGGRYDGPHGPALIIAVGAPAVDGKATEAARRALADALGVRPADVSLRLGATNRDKVFTVTSQAETGPARTATGPGQAETGPGQVEAAGRRAEGVGGRAEIVGRRVEAAGRRAEGVGGRAGSVGGRAGGVGGRAGSVGGRAGGVGGRAAGLGGAGIAARVAALRDGAG